MFESLKGSIYMLALVPACHRVLGSTLSVMSGYLWIYRTVPRFVH